MTDTYVTGRRAPASRLFGLALGGALALCLLAPASALADAGTVDLGLALERPVEPADGGTVELGLEVGTPLLTGAPQAGTVELGIEVAWGSYARVAFVGYELDGDGNVDKGSRRLLSEGTVERGGLASVPGSADRRGDGFFTDGWYATDPADSAGDNLGARVDLRDPVECDAVYYCVWRSGYAVGVDLNDGLPEDCAHAPQAEFGGMTQISATGGEVLSYADSPKPTRPGYEFMGWHLAAEGDDPVNGGRALGEEVFGPSEGELSADDVQRMSEQGTVLYAKWAPREAVRIDLTDAPGGVAGRPYDGKVSVWLWPGRGYTTTDPICREGAANPTGALAAERGLAAAAGERVAVVRDSIAAVPKPPYKTQHFAGWGTGAGEDAEKTVLLACVRVEGGYAFELTQAAVDAMGGIGADAAWDPIYKTARISVDAPFRVTFTDVRRESSLGELEDWDEAGDAGALKGVYGAAFKSEDLAARKASSGQTKTAGVNDSLLLSPQVFTNLSSDCDVYVSSLECEGVAAPTLLPNGSAGGFVFSLTEGPVGSFPAVADESSAVVFGYAGIASSASVPESAPDAKKIVLRARTDSEEYPSILWYALDLKASGFDESKVALYASEAQRDDGSSYEIVLANVRYTYSVHESLAPGASSEKGARSHA